MIHKNDGELVNKTFTGKGFLEPYGPQKCPPGGVETTGYPQKCGIF